MTEKPLSKNESKNIPEFTLQKEYLEMIQSGLKMTEGRINSGGFANLKIGSKVKFFENNNPKNYVICEILTINSYKSFAQMLESEGLENMLPGTTNLQKGVEIYEKIPNYKSKCQQSGCLGIRLKVLN